MANYRQLQTNFTAGVLDPKLAAREDIVFYYNGLKDGKNLIIIPQGGATDRPALQYVRELPPVLGAIDLSAATVTVPNGGTAGNLYDGNAETVSLATSDLDTTNPFVIAHVEFAAPQAVTAIDVINYKLDSLNLDGEMFVQYSADNSAWSNFGSAFNIDAADRSRRLSGAGGAVTAQYWRVVRIGDTDIAAAPSIGELKFWAGTATLSGARLIPFAYSTQEAYMMVASDRNIDVLRGADYFGSISIPHLSAQLPLINYTQSLDTMLIFQKNVQPWRVFRQGGDDEFDFRYQEFTNIPKYDYGAGTGGVDEVQTINDGGVLTTSGDKFTLLLEGYRTQTISVGGSRSATATAIQNALRALENTSADGITVADASGNGFAVTFGGDDGKKPWLEMSSGVMKGTAVISVSRTTRGQPPGEDIMSDTRGWPRCGVFHQSRLIMGGTLGIPDAIMMSVNSDYFNFDINKDAPDKALLFRAESDQVGAIYDIIVGRNVTLLTNDGEAFIPTTKLDEESFPKFTTDAGSKEGLKAKRVQGGIVFVQGVKDQEDDDREIGTSLQEFVPDETLASDYKTNLLSKLSGHLIKNPVDYDFRKAKNTDENDLGLLVNEDGSAVAFTILREDKVNAMVPMALRDVDKFLSVGIDKKRRVYFVTERLINGTPRRFVEMWNKDLYLDCGGIITMTAESLTAATAGQEDYIYTFTSPATTAEIAVRINGAQLDASDFSVNLITKTVTLSAALAENIAKGDIVRIAILESVVTGLDHLEGEEIFTFVDGTFKETAYTVSGGEITLAEPADIEIQYGFQFEVSGELMPFRVAEEQTLSAIEMQVVNLILNLYRTIGIELQVNGGNWQPVALQQTDRGNVLDKSALDLLYTGETEEEGFAGMEVGAPVKFRRPNAGPFTLLGITREVNV